MLDLIRMLQGWFVEWDVSMISVSRAQPAHVANSHVQDELGHVNYIISDKTGTIT